MTNLWSVKMSSKDSASQIFLALTSPPAICRISEWHTLSEPGALFLTNSLHNQSNWNKTVIDRQLNGLIWCVVLGWWGSCGHERGRRFLIILINYMYIDNLLYGVVVRRKKTLSKILNLIPTLNVLALNLKIDKKWLLLTVAFDSMVTAVNPNTLWSNSTIIWIHCRINGHPIFLEPPWVVLMKNYNRPSASFPATPKPAGTRRDMYYHSIHIFQ